MHLILPVFFLALVNLSSIYADVCIPTQHRIFTEQDLKSKFEKTKLITGASKFQSVVIDTREDKLYAGGKNTLNVFDGSTLENIKQTAWTVDNNQCLSEVQVNNKDVCQNHVTLLDLYKDTVVACATGAMRPVYRVFAKDGLNVTKVGGYRQCASPNPEHRIAGKVTALGEMIAATYSDEDGKGAQVIGSYMPEKLTVYREKLSTNDKDIKKRAEFVKNFYIEDRVYTFFMESAEENGNEVGPTVGRFCQTDNGAPSFISNQLWTTFRKARMSCHFDRSHSRIDFKYLVDVAYDSNQKLFYAVYTMTKHESLASGICTYTLAEVEQAFSQNFLEKDSNTKEWKEVANRNIFDGCEVNTTALRDNVDATSPGKEPTNSLNFQASMFLSSHRIMAKTIAPKPKVFQYMKSVTRFSRIAIDESFSKGNQTLLNIIDEKGRILVLFVHLSSIEKPCILEEINTGLDEPKFFQLNQDKRLQYITTRDGNNLMVFHMDSCARYQNQSECVYAHNPRCGWSNNSSKCISWMNRGNETLLQELNKCPKRDILSAWTGWRAHLQDGTEKKYCLARHRQCHSCDLKLCDTATVEVVNCTVNQVEDVERWLKEGSIDGSWSEWNTWSQCQNHHTKCGNDTKVRYRKCQSPKPANGGRDCLGNDFDCATCPKIKEIVNILWGQWSNWGECTQIGNSRYEQSRSRICSKPGKCSNGLPTIQRMCSPNGIIWKEWTKCSCQQKVRHRYPESIHNCTDCPKLRKAQYDTCEPIGCPTLKPTPAVVTEQQNSTNKNATTNNNNSNKNETGTDIIKVIPITPSTVPITKCMCKDGYTFQLVELVSIGVGIIASCFVIVIAIVFLILRRDRKKNEYYPSSTELKRSKSQPLLEECCDTLDSSSRESNA